MKIQRVDRERYRDDLARFVVLPEPVSVVLGHGYDKIVPLAVVPLEGSIAASLAPGEEPRPERGSVIRASFVHDGSDVMHDEDADERPGYVVNHLGCGALDDGNDMPVVGG